MRGRALRIAWLGALPSARESGGVPGVAAELLHGLAALGHQIDCFSAAAEHKLPARFSENQNLTFTWGSTGWQWGRWYSRTRIAAFTSGLFARGVGALRLRRELARRHRREPYDVIYQFSNIETLSVPSSVTRHAPLVIHPETHAAGELRFLIAERRLSFRCQPRRVFAIAVAVMSLRTLVQRVRIRRARLLVCISSAFREHLTRDYGFPSASTVVIPNPVRLERFTLSDGPPGEPARVLVLGRVAVRKGIEDVVAVARTLLERDAGAHMRVVGGPGLWSDYTKLLDDLPSENAEYLRRIAPSEIPGELARTDVLLQASRYEPFALTVAEALAAGVPVVATSEVGAIEGVDEMVAIQVAPGDVAGLATGVTDMLERLRRAPARIRATARAEAERLFAPEIVCGRISAALIDLVDGAPPAEPPVASAREPAREAQPDSGELP
jgi:glycosyltransferase involved in cell wall biosynthesis